MNPDDLVEPASGFRWGCPLCNEVSEISDERDEAVDGIREHLDERHD